MATLEGAPSAPQTVHIGETSTFPYDDDTVHEIAKQADRLTAPNTKINPRDAQAFHQQVERIATFALEVMSGQSEAPEGCALLSDHCWALLPLFNATRSAMPALSPASWTGGITQACNTVQNAHADDVLNKVYGAMYEVLNQDGRLHERVPADIQDRIGERVFRGEHIGGSGGIWYAPMTHKAHAVAKAALSRDSIVAKIIRAAMVIPKDVSDGMTSPPAAPANPFIIPNGAYPIKQQG